MKDYMKLQFYPCGAISPDGFLRQQCEKCRDGMGGHLDELEPGMIGDPFIHKTYVKAWGDGDQSGWGAEISGNYWTGLIELAFTMHDEALMKKAAAWVDGLLKNRRADGYLGTYYEEDADIYDDYNAWGTACMLRGLIAFYEATGRKDVLDAAHGCLLWFCRTWSGEHKTAYAGPFIIEPLVMVYRLTEDEALRDFAVEYTEWLCTHDVFSKSYKAMLTEKFRYNADHTAGLGTTARLPALVYGITGRKELLDATVRRLDLVEKYATQLSGGPVSVTEYVGPKSAVHETEYCSFAFFNAAFAAMSAITGSTVYADRMERMFYNGAQGARKKDEKCIAYLSAPNQIFATLTSSYSQGDMQVYAPCYPVACCPVNAVALLPEFIKSMFLHDGDGRVYASCFGPCTLRIGNVTLKEETRYPFRDDVTFTLSGGELCGFYVRVPAWAKGYTVTVNGKRVEEYADENGYLCVGRLLDGDTVHVTFTVETEVVRVDDTDAAKKYPLAVRRGALLYAFHIPEKWQAVKGNPMTPLPEGWSWYNVLPDFKEPDAPDAHERIGLRRYTFPWNFALSEKLCASDITVEERETDGYAWSDPPIVLKLTARRAPYLTQVYPQKTFEPFCEYQEVTDELPLTLEPFGCTNLRICYFPKYRDV